MSLLNEEFVSEGIDLSFSDEEIDDEVTHMLLLISEDHPFEQNSWTCGKDAAEVHEEVVTRK